MLDFSKVFAQKSEKIKSHTENHLLCGLTQGDPLYHGRECVPSALNKLMLERLVGSSSGCFNRQTGVLFVSSQLLGNFPFS